MPEALLSVEVVSPRMAGEGAAAVRASGLGRRAASMAPEVMLEAFRAVRLAPEPENVPEMMFDALESVRALAYVPERRAEGMVPAERLAAF